MPERKKEVPHADTQDVEISPEMVAAGEVAYEWFFETYPPHMLVQEIYKAMTLAAKHTK